MTDRHALAQELVHYDTAVPRYTSYPTAPIWGRDLPLDTWEQALAAVDPPASVYVHIPFCREQCWFCGCNMVVAGRQQAGDRYLDALERQIESLPLGRETLPIARLHLGGGTPTWLDGPQLERLYTMLYRRFTPVSECEVSLEADPDLTTDAQVDQLAELGVNRLSLGVQSFDRRVLDAIHRPQDADRIGAILERARQRGMWGLNLDLVYGLPHQDEASLDDTLQRVLDLRPDRLALYSYAHVPWMKPHQKRIDEAALPGPVQKMSLFLLARERLQQAGFRAIGMDHFALPDDELTVAQEQGALHRNFMGYTTQADMELIGLGMSAISELGGLYAQQPAKLGTWYRAVEGKAPLIERGWALDADDRLRKDIIQRLMCSFQLRYDDIERRHGVDFRRDLAPELTALEERAREGLVRLSADGIQTTDVGRLLVRHVAAVFDRWRDQGGRYSKGI